jgi:hypothetical protein
MHTIGINYDTARYPMGLVATVPIIVHLVLIVPFHPFNHRSSKLGLLECLSVNENVFVKVLDAIDEDFVVVVVVVVGGGGSSGGLNTPLIGNVLYLR